MCPIAARRRLRTIDLIGGQIDYLCGNLSVGALLIAGKQVKAIAVLSGGRTPLMPDLATAHEQGLTGFDVTSWTAFFLPSALRGPSSTSRAPDDGRIDCGRGSAPRPRSRHWNGRSNGEFAGR
jgi:hypothetical protein